MKHETVVVTVCVEGAGANPPISTARRRPRDILPAHDVDELRLAIRALAGIRDILSPPSETANDEPGILLLEEKKKIPFGMMT